MVRRLKAIYSGKALIPQGPCDFPEGSVVDLIVQGVSVEGPQVTDAAERSRALRMLVARMRRNPVGPNAPRLTRDQMHERG